MALNETQLLHQLRAGNQRAVLHWYQLYAPRLTAFIARKVTPSADIEELVQDTFINCLRALPQYAGKSSLWTWMCAIAKHEVGDYYRKKYAKKVLRALPLSDWLWGDLLPSPTKHANLVVNDCDELGEKLEHVWQKIGHYYQELLQEKYLDQVSVAQLAAKRGKTLKAVESELFRARRAFKKAYHEVNA